MQITALGLVEAHQSKSSTSMKSIAQVTLGSLGHPVQTNSPHTTTDAPSGERPKLPADGQLTRCPLAVILVVHETFCVRMRFVYECVSCI